ncbi:MAG: D-glycero-beta-D-manno-heptose-7-phosphate kinase [Acidobacteria bacterium]|nr:D-glycero-beta-D-manno-heptose-7-phosphate kinase [Acidobacteriota bacterium]
MTNLSHLLPRLAGHTILVVGDVMLDHFVIGSVERISPEAPVPVVRFAREEYRLGGAANVAANLQALGARAEVVGIVGDDAEGERLRAALARAGAGTDGIVTDPARCTTRKTRVVTSRNQQVARIDYESDAEASGAVAAALVSRVERLATTAGAVLISDYLKGVVSRDVSAAAIAAAARHGIPVAVDPKVPHADYYRGATLVTPNHLEAEAVTHMRIRDGVDVGACARRVSELTGCTNVLITRGEHGMWLHTPGDDIALPAEAREVSDVTGAGDTVIATLTLALASGASLEQAARLANRAAGIVVGKFGPATVSLEELS